MAGSAARLAAMTPSPSRWSAVALDGAVRSSAHASEVVVRLDSGQVWTRRVKRGADLSVTCLHGQVWMTHEGDYRDHFLRVEGTYTSREPGLVCVQAMAPSQLLVTSK